MESTLQDLKNRRSIRSFKPEQITDEELEKILEAGIFAPTGMGRQSPKIVVIQDRATIDKLSKMNAQYFPRAVNVDLFYGAPTLIVVLADRSAITYREDGSLVIGNMMNAASAIGVGSCWIHRAKEEFESEEGQQLLKEWGITGDYEGIGHCVLGYPVQDESPKAAPRKEDYIVYVR
jgi:nitroreductase